jgi:hypothetical protein
MILNAYGQPVVDARKIETNLLDENIVAFDPPDTDVAGGQIPFEAYYKRRSDVSDGESSIAWHDLNRKYIIDEAPTNPMTFKPIQHASGDWTKKGEIWQQNRRIIPAGGGSGFPPVPPNGNYYQKGKPNKPAQQQEPIYSNILSHMLQGFYDATIGGLKEGVYDTYVRWPLIMRDWLMTKANNMGKVPNFLSSLYAMGADCGPLQRVIDDWKDRLEIYTDQYGNLLGVRTYNTRQETDLLKWLRKGKENVIPREGIAVESIEDLELTHEGQIKGFKPDVGGVPLSLDGVQYDEFYADSDTEYWVTHGESKTSNPGKFRKNMVSFALSHYIYSGKGDIKYVGRHAESGTEITRITLPHGYGIHQWDSDLAIKTFGTAVGIYVTHFLYAAAERGLEKFGKKGIERAKKLEQAELDRMMIADKPPITRIGYG